MKTVLVGAGAFGLKHLDAIKLIGGIEVVSLIGREPDKTREAAKRYLKIQGDAMKRCDVPR